MQKHEKEMFQKMKDLDPSMREFDYPDFGFHDHLNHYSGDKSIWEILSDHISQFPKYERLRNYINDCTVLKLKKIREELDRQ